MGQHDRVVGCIKRVISAPKLGLGFKNIHLFSLPHLNIFPFVNIISSNRFDPKPMPFEEYSMVNTLAPLGEGDLLGV
jgi:hypothetical protein